MSHILITEDEDRIAGFLQNGLRAAGYLTTRVRDGESSLLLSRTGEFDLVILDLGLPRMPGDEVVRAMRQANDRTPVIVLTAQDPASTSAELLSCGADDYMSKPFHFAELLARIRLRIRTEPAGASSPVVVEAAGMSLDLRSRGLTVDGKTVNLTAREFTLMETLLRHPGQVLTREQLLSHVWGMQTDTSSNVVDVFVRSLRSKIGAGHIETVRGVGYRLVQP